MKLSFSDAILTRCRSQNPCLLCCSVAVKYALENFFIHLDYISIALDCFYVATMLIGMLLLSDLFL